MKKSFKLLASMLAIATCALFITSCDKDEPAPATVTSVTIVTTPNPRTLVKGDTVNLTAKIEPAGVATELKWSSSNTAAVDVVKTGDLTATVTAKEVSDGKEITITVAATNGKQATFKVTVVAQPILLTGLAITPDKDTTITAGQTVEYTATPTPANATDYAPVWSSGNPAVATVSQTGVVDAVSAGTAYIKVASGDYADSVLVTVKATTVTGIEITPSEGKTLAIGDSTAYTATPTPANATDYAPVWSSSNDARATVSQTGVVTAVSEGEVFIKVVSGDIADSVAVTVVAAVAPPLDSITVELSSDLPIHPNSEHGGRKVLVSGEPLQIKIIPHPANAADFAPRWYSNDEGKVTVDGEGNVTTVDAGGVNVYCFSGPDGAPNIHMITVELIVVANLSDIKLSPAGESHTLYVGSSMKITASPVPAEPYDGYNPVWSSNSTSVASVDNDGVITAHTVGTATITVTSGSITKSVEIKVEVYETSIDANGKYSTNGWTAESRGGNHPWSPDGGPDEDAGAPKYAIDGDRRTGWHSNTGNPLPQCFVVDMKESIDVDRIKISHIPDDEFRQDEGKGKNWIYYKTIQVYLSDTYVDPNMEGLPESLGSPVASLDYVNATNSAEDIATIDFGATGKGRYLILFFPDSAVEPYISFAEVEVYKNIE